MKKLSLTIATFAIIGMIGTTFSACNDEQDVLVISTKVAGPEQDGPYDMGKMYATGCTSETCTDEDRTDMHCHYNERGNCFRPVVISSTQSELLVALNSAVDSGYIARFVTDNFSDLGNCFDTILLREVELGNITVTYRNSRVENKYYYIFAEVSTDSVETVYPFIQR